MGGALKDMSTIQNDKYTKPYLNEQNYKTLELMV